MNIYHLIIRASSEDLMNSTGMYNAISYPLKQLRQSTHSLKRNLQFMHALCSSVSCQQISLSPPLELVETLIDTYVTRDQGSTLDCKWLPYAIILSTQIPP